MQSPQLKSPGPPLPDSIRERMALLTLAGSFEKAPLVGAQSEESLEQSVMMTSSSAILDFFGDVSAANIRKMPEVSSRRSSLAAGESLAGSRRGSTVSAGGGDLAQGVAEQLQKRRNSTNITVGVEEIPMVARDCLPLPLPEKKSRRRSIVEVITAKIAPSSKKGTRKESSATGAIAMGEPTTRRLSSSSSSNSHASNVQNSKSSKTVSISEQDEEEDEKSKELREKRSECLGWHRDFFDDGKW